MSLCAGHYARHSRLQRTQQRPALKAARFQQGQHRRAETGKETLEEVVPPDLQLGKLSWAADPGLLGSDLGCVCIRVCVCLCVSASFIRAVHRSNNGHLISGFYTIEESFSPSPNNP